MTKPEYVILDNEYDSVESHSNLQEARVEAEKFAKANPGDQYFIATITHRIKAVIKTKWDE
jgi:hypothetical protein